MVNYIDRGIIPGAPFQFENFICKTINPPQEDQSTWIGALTSSFIGCFSVASLVFSKAASRYNHFTLLCIGLSIWTAALFLSGLPYFFQDSGAPAFWIFLLARSLSGVGEAAFQCIVPPYLEDIAPRGKQTLWLGVFYTAIPSGTAIGYLYSAGLAPAPPKSIGWGWAYILEAMLMLPFAIGTLFLPKAAEYDEPASVMDEHLLNSNSLADPARISGASHEHSQTPTHADVQLVMDAGKPAGAHTSAPAAAINTGWVTEATEAHGFVSMFNTILRTPPYVLLVLGYSAYTATLIGISSFGPLFMLGFGLFDTEQKASATFGMIVAIGGVVGTPLGGAFVDRGVKRARESRELKLAALRAPSLSVTHAALEDSKVIMSMLTGMVSIGCVLLISCIISLEVVRSTMVFLALLCLAVIFTFSTSAGITRCTMLLFPHHMRAFALAWQNLMIHAVGDVPSPVVVGALLSKLAPHCTVMQNGTGCVESGDAALDPRCQSENQHGLFITMLLAGVWMWWAIALWAAGAFLIWLRCRRLARGRVLPSGVPELTGAAHSDTPPRVNSLN